MEQQTDNDRTVKHPRIAGSKMRFSRKLTGLDRRGEIAEGLKESTEEFVQKVIELIPGDVPYPKARGNQYDQINLVWELPDNDSKQLFVEFWDDGQFDFTMKEEGKEIILREECRNPRDLVPYLVKFELQEVQLEEWQVKPESYRGEQGV